MGMGMGTRKLAPGVFVRDHKLWKKVDGKNIRVDSLGRRIPSRIPWKRDKRVKNPVSKPRARETHAQIEAYNTRLNEIGKLLDYFRDLLDQAAGPCTGHASGIVRPRDELFTCLRFSVKASLRPQYGV